MMRGDGMKAPTTVLSYPFTKLPREFCKGEVLSCDRIEIVSERGFRVKIWRVD